ncbi:MAG: FAD-dependent oxidoreductase [Oceanospirillaceae bacterium]|nr:FAD-dependent oxidoreductase [Oceanospirillaceae bacterium]
MPDQTACMISVIVIGAGVSGLTAARNLARAGVSVQILESRDRLGGRVWTDRRLGVPVELGASWLHDAAHNPLASLSTDNHLATTATNHADQTLFRDGTRLAPEQGKALIGRFYRQLSEMAAALPAGEDLSLAAALDRSQAAKEITASDRDAIRWGLSFSRLVEGADETDLSLRGLAADMEAPDQDRMVIGGFDSLIGQLATGLDIRLSHPVQAIRQNRETVSVRVGREWLSSRFAIVTLPLGVLRAGDVCFSPPLPDEQRAAATELGNGLLLKVAARFSVPFWATRSQALSAVGGVDPDFFYFLNGWAYQNVPLLQGFAGGHRARVLEGMSNRQVMEIFLKDLKDLLGQTPPPLQDAIVTRWGSDPWARGAYSYRRVGHDDRIHHQLAAAMGRLHFAGEHTSANHPATVAGAYRSGLRAAREVLARL